jgi:uncharacterized protein
MNFTEKINADIKAAMLSKDKDRLAALRDVKSKLLLEATAGSGEVTEEASLKIVMKLHKQRVETHALYVAQNREDLAADELFQAQVLEEYLPKMMTEEEVKAEVLVVIAATGAKGPQEMGKVMGVLTSKLAGKADGKLISTLVKEALAK